MISLNKEEKRRLIPLSAPSSPTGSYQRGSCYVQPTRSRLQSLTIVNTRIRSNSVTIYNDDGDDVTSTSYGPVMLEEDLARTDWLLGWFLAIISGVLFTANNFFVKYLSVDAIEMLLMRSVMQTVLLGVVIMSTTRKFLPDGALDKVLVILQGLFSGARIFLQFACLAYMPLGDALTLVFTEPLWTLMLSKLVLKISIGVWKMVFGVVLIGGMVLCIQPPFIFTPDPEMPANLTNISDLNSTVAIAASGGLKEAVLLLRDFIQDEEVDPSSDAEYGGGYYLGALLAISTAITGAMANVIIAKCEKVSSSVMVFFSGLGGVVLALVFSIFDKDNRIIFNFTSISLEQWLILAMLGGMGIIGYFSMTRSLQLIPPTTVAVLRAMEIILAYIAQAVVMREVPDSLAITGSSLVMLSVVAFALEELIIGCF